MKRGVPPTARNARTGELTPPGMTFWARSNRDWLLIDSMDVSGARGRAFFRAAFGARLAFFGRGQRPEEAIRDHVAHAGAKARVECLVEEGERFAHRGMELAAGRQQGRQRGRQRVAGADEADLEALELLAGDRALR